MERRNVESRYGDTILLFVTNKESIKNVCNRLAESDTVRTKPYIIGQVIFCQAKSSKACSSLSRDFEKACAATVILSSASWVCLVAVEGMTCQACVQTIESMLAKVAGVTTVKVSLESNEAFVGYNPSEIDSLKICKEVSEMGFGSAEISVWTPESVKNGPKSLSADGKTASGRSCATITNATPVLSVADCDPPLSPRLNLSGEVVQFNIEGMRSMSCQEKLETKINEMAGVHSVTTSLQDCRAEIQYDPGITSPNLLRKAISQSGFSASLVQKSTPTTATFCTGIEGMRSTYYLLQFYASMNYFSIEKGIRLASNVVLIHN